MRPRITITQWQSWQGDETKVRGPARFKAPLVKTIALLEHELEQMDVADVEVAFGLSREAFSRRGGGWPLVNAQGHPGVVVTYTHPKLGVIRLATDKFYEWEDNLRGIAMTIEALRMMERYGTTGNGRQYEGFRAIPASTGDTMDVLEAAKLIKQWGQLKFPAERLLEVRELAEIGVRAAIYKAHPDQNPDIPPAVQTDTFHLVERARQALSAHHGGGL